METFYHFCSKIKFNLETKNLSNLIEVEITKY